MRGCLQAALILIAIFGLSPVECLGQSASNTTAPPQDKLPNSIRPQGAIERPTAGFSNADLDNAWNAYELAISAAAARVQEALGDARQAARERGDLEAAKSLRTAIEAFEENGEWPTLREVEKVTADARSSCKQAMSNLGQAYVLVVQALTKDTTLDDAVAESVEAERRKLFALDSGAVRGVRRPQRDDPAVTKSGKVVPSAPPTCTFIEWKSGGAADTRLIQKDEGFCFLAGIEGNFEGGGESAMLSIEADGFWHLRAQSGQPGLRVRIGVVRSRNPAR
jgi:hypothetical protein